MYFGRWSKFRRSNKSAIFSFWWLGCKENQQSRTNRRTDKVLHEWVRDVWAAGLEQRQDKSASWQFILKMLKKWNAESAEALWRLKIEPLCGSSAKRLAGQTQNQNWYRSLLPHQTLQPSITAATACTVQDANPVYIQSAISSSPKTLREQSHVRSALKISVAEMGLLAACSKELLWPGQEALRWKVIDTPNIPARTLK